MQGLKLIDQLVAELQRQAEEIDRLQYGEVILKVQDGRLVKWDVKKSYKVGGTDPNNGRPEA